MSDRLKIMIRFNVLQHFNEIYYYYYYITLIIYYYEDATKRLYRRPLLHATITSITRQERLSEVILCCYLPFPP